jgi:hypothetical protein
MTGEKPEIDEQRVETEERAASQDVAFRLYALVTETDWVELQELIDPTMSDSAVANIMEQLRSAGSRSVILEEDYLDRDFSEEFKAFYSTLFRRYRRHTERLHFFKTDVAPLLAATNTASDIARGLEEISERLEYLGFIVLRPVPGARIGRAVLNILSSPADVHVTLQVRAAYEVHLFGATLTVTGAPFTQQHSRITACAQASLWIAGRHLCTRHHGPWLSTVKIAEAASTPTDVMLAQSLPAGTGGLSITNMVRAMRTMETQPLVFNAERESDGKLRWAEYLKPQAIISRYVESGLPVIVGLDGFENSPDEMPRDGHAVVVVGTSFRARPNLTFADEHPHVSEYNPYFLVHDDQRGINLKMPVVDENEEEHTPYNVHDHVFFILVPLPNKVFMTAEAAERKAWDHLENFYSQEWPTVKEKNASEIGASREIGDRIGVALHQRSLVARTYLRSGWKYKRWIANSDAHDVVKAKVIYQQLSRMVWVTEFGLASELNRVDPEQRRIVSHCVIDATGSNLQSPLILHVPGFVYLWSQSGLEFLQETPPQMYSVEGDHAYRARHRTMPKR